MRASHALASARTSQLLPTSSHRERPEDIAAATDLLQEAAKDKNQSCADALIDLLRVCKSRTDARHWKKPRNHVSDKLLKLVRKLLVDRDRPVRIQAARALRYLMWDKSVLKQIVRHNIPSFICRCLERDQQSKSLWERMQALKWIRAAKEMDPESLPRCCMVSLVAVASCQKEEFRRACLLTLREMAELYPGIVAGCGGIRCLVDGTLDPILSDMGPNLIRTLLKILDNPETRIFIRPKTDIQRLLWSFGHCEPGVYGRGSDPQMKANMLKEKTHAQEAAEKTLYRLLSSSTGLIYLAGDSAHGGIKALCDILALPPSVKSVSWAKGALYRVVGDVLTPGLLNSKPVDQRGPNLMASFVALTLSAFIENGLVEALAQGGLYDQEQDPKNTVKARNLLARVQELGGRYLTKAMCTRITSIPPVVNTASIFGKSVSQVGLRLTNLETSVKRSWAAAMVTELANADTFQTHGVPIVTKIMTAKNWDVMNLAFATDVNSSMIRYRYLRDPDSIVVSNQLHLPFFNHRDSDINETFENGTLERISSLRSAPSVKITKRAKEKSYIKTSQKSAILERMKHQRDEDYSPESMSHLLKNTVNKDFTQWHYADLWRILNGPLWHENHLKTALGAKFFKRICQWIQPKAGNFQKTNWNVENMEYARVACQVFRVMTSSRETCDYQYFKAAVKNIWDCFQQQLTTNDLNVDSRKNKRQKNDFVFDSHFVKISLSRIYFALIGILSESTVGLELFKELNFFETLSTRVRKDIIQLGKGYVNSPNDYLIRELAVKLDYTHSNADSTRILFTIWIEQGSQNLRRYLTNHLNVLFRSQIHGRVFRQWAIKILVMQLNKQSDLKLSLTALRALENTCCRVSDPFMEEHIEEIINGKPNPDMVGSRGDSLFIKLLTKENGYKYMQTCGNWLEDQRKSWLKEKNEKYVLDLEKALTRAARETMTGPRAMSNERKEEPSAASIEDEKSEEVTDYDYHDHLVLEHYSEQEEYYNELLSELPWNIQLSINSAGSTTTIPTDSYFDYNAFYPPEHDDDLPRQLGPGCVGVCLGLNSRKSQSWPLTPGCCVKVRLFCGKTQLDVVPNISERTIKYTGKEPFFNSTDTIIQKQGVTLHLKSSGKKSEGTRNLVQVIFHVPIIQTNFNIVRPLPHFYGELAATVEGCDFIKSKGDIHKLSKVLKTAVHGRLPSEKNLELRASIWAFGMIGSTEIGLNLLHETDSFLLGEIAQLSYSSLTLSIRTTCFLAMGMVARTEAGQETLKNLGYQFPVDNLELDLAIAIPINLKQFFSQPSDEHYEGSWALNEKNCFHVPSPPKLSKPSSLKKKDSIDPIGDPNRLEETILAHIAALACNVTQKYSCDALSKIKQKKSALFESPVLFREVCKLMNAYQFKLPARQFITFRLFDHVRWGDMQAFDVPMDTPIEPISKEKIQNNISPMHQSVNKTVKSSAPVRRSGKAPRVVRNNKSKKERPPVEELPGRHPRISDSHDNDIQSSTNSPSTKRNLSPSEGPTPFDGRAKTGKEDEPPSPHHQGYNTEYRDRFKYQI